MVRSCCSKDCGEMIVKLADIKKKYMSASNIDDMLKLTQQFHFYYDRLSRAGIHIFAFIVYSVENYVGNITNKEPHKCNSLKWFSIEELKRLFEKNKDNAALECILKCVKF